MEVRWLSALLRTSAERFIDGGAYDERAAFVQQAQAWLGQLDETQAAALRLCMILHEPPEPDESQNGDNADEAADDVWALTLHLQGFDGEGDLIDAAVLWQGGAGAAAPILGRTIARRRAALLSEISRAAEVFPAMGQLLAHPAPAEMKLPTTDAWAFIRHWAPLLRESGFVVTLPTWTSMPDPEMGLRLLLSPGEDSESIFDVLEMPMPQRARPRGRAGEVGEAIELSSGHFGLDSLMNFNWQVAVGEQRLSAAEFEKLVERNVPLVRHKGRWVHLDVESARRAVEFVKKREAGQITLADAFRTAFTANKAETGLDVVGLSGTGWIERLLEQSPGKAIEAIAQPAGFVGELRPYQLRGLHWLSFMDRLGLGACLADDMGLGKTIQLIALLLEERERKKPEAGSQKAESGARSEKREARSDEFPSARDSGLGTQDSSSPGPTLLFAPTSVVGNWLREVQRFAPSLAVLVHHGPERLAGEKLRREALAADVVITSYSLASRDKDDLAKVPWRRVVLDEAQKIKNPAAAATSAIRALSAPAPRRVAMTGTPIENHLSELWSIMQVLNPGLLGSAADFREKFAVPIEKLGERDRAEQLRRMIRPFVLRRTKQDPVIAGDLPEKLEMKVFCNLTAEQAALYERLVNDSLRQIDGASGIRRRGLILATLTRLKQICDHPALLEEEAATLDQRSGKCERLVEMLEELLEEGDAALVFTQYREMGHLLEKVIKSRLKEPTFFLHGGTPAKGRDDMILKFQKQERGTPRIFLLSLRAGGLGLNLTAANHVFHFDRWWNPAVEAQATDRAHRVGQTRKVQVHKFVCIGTMEERIDRLLSEKQALANQIVGGGDEWLTGLSTDQLREYLTLSKEAVGEFE
jgi:non-specific serine/threonine protein kinase